MQIKGVVARIGAVEQVSPTFSKRQLVLTTQEQYPQTLAVEFIKDKTNLLDPFGVGQVVEVDVNLRGREWVDHNGVPKYFTSLNGWRIGLVHAPEQAAAPATAADDDVPF